MERGNGRTRTVARLALGTFAILVARRGLAAFAILAAVAGARAAEGKGDSPLPVVVASAPAGCKKLGEVKGSHQDIATPSVERAQRYALEDARDLGATHVLTVASGLRYKMAYYRGIAYRCPPSPASNHSR